MAESTPLQTLNIVVAAIVALCILRRLGQMPASPQILASVGWHGGKPKR